MSIRFPKFYETRGNLKKMIISKHHKLEYYQVFKNRTAVILWALAVRGCALLGKL